MVPDIKNAKATADAHCAAWTAGDAAKVAERYSEPTSFGMNWGAPMTTRAEVREMAQGFMSDFPGLTLVCDSVLVADHHMVYAWTFEGVHAATGNQVRFSGWEEWDLDEKLEVAKSLGWYDVEDYTRQTEG